MDWLFGRRMTPEEMLRKNQRLIQTKLQNLAEEKEEMERQLIEEMEEKIQDKIVEDSENSRYLHKYIHLHILELLENNGLQLTARRFLAIFIFGFRT